MWRGVPKRAIGGAVVGLIAFVVSCSATVSETQDGRLVKCGYLDYFAMLAGGIAGAAGLSILAMKEVPFLHRIGYMVALAGLGAVQILRGFGYIGEPCN